MPLGLRKEHYIDRNPNGGLDHLTHARAMLSQVKCIKLYTAPTSFYKIF